MSNLATIISVPRLPPAIDGVGDYALNLARQLRKDFNIQTHFIVGNSTWKCAENLRSSKLIFQEAIPKNYYQDHNILLIGKSIIAKIIFT